MIMETTNKPAFDICFSDCQSCAFWLRDLEVSRVGACVRHAPRPYYEVYSTCAEAQEKRERGRIIWPETKATDFCGEWQSSRGKDEEDEDNNF